MIRDITIGQYFPGQSAIHRMDPGSKSSFPSSISSCCLWRIICGAAAGRSFRLCGLSHQPHPRFDDLKSMKPVVPIVIFTAVLNLFLSTGDPLWQWKFLKITKEGIETAVFMSVRILCLIAGTSLLTYTTSPIALTDGIERLLSPLKKSSCRCMSWP